MPEHFMIGAVYPECTAGCLGVFGGILVSIRHEYLQNTSSIPKTLNHKNHPLLPVNPLKMY